MMSISIAVRNFRRNVDAAIQASGLPAAILEPVLSCYALQLGELAARQAEIDETAGDETAGKEKADGE